MLCNGKPVLLDSSLEVAASWFMMSYHQGLEKKKFFAPARDHGVDRPRKNEA